MSTPATIVWLRQDLRWRDNPALQAAFARGGPVIPVYIRDDAGEGDWAPGAASRWWLYHSLGSLGEAVAPRGGRLVLARGRSEDALRRLSHEAGADAVYWNRRYEPAVRARDAQVERALAADGLDVRTFNAALLHEPDQVLNKQGRPFQVFTPYWRTCLVRPVEEPRGGLPRTWPAPPRWPASPRLDELELLPSGMWADKLASHWQPGEAGAQAALRRFVRHNVHSYDQDRDRPDRTGTSQLSPHLHYGEIGPRQVWAAVRALGEETGVFPPSNGARVFLTELGWREFAYHQLYHFPHTPERPLRVEFERFAWREDRDGRWRHAWQRGRTGYPLVDAGLRQLWQTGWMHNRVRMIVASFLVKHLRLPWTIGAAWFWDTLVDADLANNTLGWQWTAGCGADAAPFFRIFNPTTQGERYDPDGTYVRQWLPELAALPTKLLHAPWQATPLELAAAGVTLGETYPEPIVDHATARAEALDALQQLRSSS